MKKAILIIIIIGMFSWALYDFVFSSNKTAQEADAPPAGNQITSQENQTSEVEKTGDSSEVGLEVGNLAPDFKLPTLDGELIQLSELRGKRVMVNFWATWCPPCRAEMPDMQKFHENKDINILAVNLTETEGDLMNIQNFVSEYELTFPILKDENTEVANRYQIQPIPSTFMIDSNGIIQYKAFGAMNYDLMVQEFEKME
ncbi:peroxiredoxin family protein [Virgibacillus pantothenticus]|uniref:Alkyl hydroperoxide reductase n=1 Tax=Virgibacillus pantothenticus TaxID=1473 RepID=A0A0L0QS10_VIRPA|nr:redoxin domain-containing protein [Virgibacillus pantothenticus]KNE21352.1 alkyl hydroperoxide reductase [Virgibacillus pantothenticus]MED3737747.1 redoxin domain-containing protein [Virgibacillus pantothenticus]QTY16227.1 redoxin domain-containing protein [Virgibacillus pantothenticus]SIS70326.1 Peroxiredoxin [Virgibacillus pantothenticus]